MPAGPMKRRFLAHRGPAIQRLAYPLSRPKARFTVRHQLAALAFLSFTAAALSETFGR